MVPPAIVQSARGRRNMSLMENADDANLAERRSVEVAQ